MKAARRAKRAGPADQARIPKRESADAEGGSLQHPPTWFRGECVGVRLVWGATFAATPKSYPISGHWQARGRVEKKSADVEGGSLLHPPTCFWGGVCRFPQGTFGGEISACGDTQEIPHFRPFTMP